MRLLAHRRAVLLSSVLSVVTPPAPLLAPLPALAAAEISDETQLVVDAWAVVQRAFYDPQYNGVDWKAVRADYVKRPYKSMKAARSAVAEMLGLLGDKYTRYVTPSAYETLLARFEAKGTDGGIGVVLRERGSAIELVSVASGSPAASGGLRAGDVIVGVDGRRLPKGATAEDVAALILGPLSEPLTLSIARAGGSTSASDPQGAAAEAPSAPAEDVSLRRAPISSGEVRARQVTAADGRRVGVLTIPQFSEGASWAASLTDGLAQATTPKADALLLDLRGNPGGHFPTGVAAARLFLPADALIVTTRDRNGNSAPLSATAAGPYASGAGGDSSPSSAAAPPLYLLVDRGTASAAEVFAAALQDNGRALVVGETATFGKGLVQTIARVSDGGAVVCTTARYLTPNGRDLNGVGVRPDRTIACEAGADAAACLERALSTTT